MNVQEKVLEVLLGEEGDLFYRKAKALAAFYSNCPLGEYQGTALYPSGRIRKPSFITGLTVNLNELDEAAAQAVERKYMRPYCLVSGEHRVAGGMYTHSMPHYERVLKEGLFSYYARIDAMGDPSLRSGLRLLLEGIETYVERIVAYLEEVHAEERLISAMKQVPMRPARTLYEAIVAWNFVLYLDGCDNLGCVASGLLPYYNGENAVPLLEELFANLDANNGFSMALGRDYNPLTLQCLEAAKGKRRPMIELFVDETTPQEIWDKAFEIVKTTGGQPAFYNPKALLGGLQRRIPTIRDEDIGRFCGGGCTEAMLAGLSNVGSLDAGVNLLLILERCIHKELEYCADFEDFYRRYLAAVERDVTMVTEQISLSQITRAACNPLPMRTLLVDDCIENGVEYNSGGARYRWSIISFAGLVNVIDSLLVIKDFVFDNGRYTAAELLEKLKREDEAFLHQARSCSLCYGNDNKEANDLSHRLSADIFSLLDDKKPHFGQAFLPASILFQYQISAGMWVGCTPDGRAAGAPLADSLGAIFGKDTKGPTALLNSVAALDLQRALGVPVLNFNVTPSFHNDVLRALILGYMEQGGIQMQITCVSRELLEEAYRQPELHKNLIVRVGGYSEYFYRLSDELKRMVIERTIQQGV